MVIVFPFALGYQQRFKGTWNETLVSSGADCREYCRPEMVICGVEAIRGCVVSSSGRQLCADEKSETGTEPKSDSKSDAKDEEKPVDARMELEITINRPEGSSRGYRRPYVAAWLTDKDGVPVRTLVLWVQKSQPGPRWIPDLRQWNREDRLRKLVDDRDLVDAVASPTRNAGEYKVIWDGKDDQGQSCLLELIL